MSTTVDQRVVSLKFDNSQFEQNVQVSLTTLDKLRESLKFGDETKKTFEDIEKNSDNVKMGGLSSAIEQIKLKFSSLDVIAATVLANITNAVTNKVTGALRSAFDSVIGGGIRRAQNLEKAYFTMGNLFQDMGESVWDTGKKTSKVMDWVQQAVDGTAFSMDEAAVVASQLSATFGETTFTSSIMSNSLNTIANVASITGSSFQDMGNIFATIAGNGRLMGEQLLQFSSRGINVAADLAEAWGKTEEEVRDDVSKGKISYEEFIDTIGSMPKYMGAAAKANKTFSGALANTKSALARIGAEVAIPALESLRQVLLACKVAIDVVHKVMQPFLDAIAKLIGYLSMKAVRVLDKFSSSLADITNRYKQGEVGVKKLNSRGEKLAKTFEGIIAIFQSLGIIIGMFFNIITVPIRPLLSALGLVNDGLLTVTSSVAESVIAFRDWVSELSGNLNSKLDTLNKAIISLAKGFGNWLLNFTRIGRYFKSFTKNLSGGTKSLKKFSDLFKLSIKDSKTGKTTFTAFGKAVNGVKKAVDFLLSPLRAYFTAINDGIKPGKAFNNMLKEYKTNFSIANVLKGVHNILNSIGDVLSEVIDKVASFFGKDIDAKEQFEKLGKDTKDIADNTSKSITALEQFKRTVERVSTALQNAVTGNLGVGEVLAVLLGVGLIYGLRKLSKTIITLEPVSQLLVSLTGSIKQVGKAIKDFRFVMVTKQITTFTLALTALVVAMTQLAELPADQVWAAGTSVAMIAAVIGGMAIALTALSGKKGDKISKAASKGGPLLTVSKLIMSLAVAIGLLAAAIGLFGSYENGTFEKGLKRFVLVMIVLCGATLVLSKMKTRIIASSKMIYAIAGAMLILSFALKLISTITVTKSLLGTTLLLIILMRAMANLVRRISVIGMLSGKTLNAKAVSGLLNVSIAIAVLAIALKILSKIDFDSKLAKNMTAFGLIFAAMVGIMVVVGKFGGANAHKAGVALLAMSVSLGLMCLVMKIAGTLTAREIVMGIYVANSLMTFFAAVVVATKFAGKHAAKAGVALIAFGGAMVLITASMAVLSHLSLAGIAKGIIAIDAVGIMMTALIKSTEKAKITSSVKGTILMFGVVIAVMTASLGVLSMIKTSKLLTSIFALTAVMAAFNSMMYMISKMDIKEKTIATLGVMAGCVAAIGLVIFLVGSLKPENAIAAAIALTSTIMAVAGALFIIDNIKWTPTKSLKNMGILAAIMVVCGAFIFAISKMNVKPAHAAAIAALGAILIPLSVSLFILSKIGPSAEAALPAIGVIMIVILAIGAAFTALGYVFNGDKGKKLAKAMDTGIEIMGKLGKMIGAFVGGIAGGVVEYASKGLIELGTNLSKFMDNASGFIEGMKNVPDGLGANAKNLAGAILALSGAKFIDSFSNFMSWLQWPFGNPDKEFAKNIGYLADGIKDFADKVSGIEGKTESINAAATAAKAISKFFEAIPKSGGFVQWLEGTTDVDAFIGPKGGKLKKIAEAIVKCSSAFDGGVEINTSAIKKASEAAGYIAEFAQKIPKSGGWVQKIAGEQDLGAFSDNVVIFGSAIKEFANNVSGIEDMDSVKMAAQACSQLAVAANDIQTIGAMGWQNVPAFSKNAPEFGKAMSDFSTNVGEVKGKKILNVASAGVELAKAIKKAASVSSSDNLAGFKNMAANLGGAIDNAAKTATAKTKNVTQKVKVSTKANIDTSSITSGMSAIGKAGSASSQAAKRSGKQLANNVKEGIESVKGWKSAGKHAAQGFIDGIISREMTKKSSAAGRKIANAAYKAARKTLEEKSPSRRMMEVGSYAGEGFVIGLEDWAEKSFKAGENVSSLAVDGISSSIATVADIIDNGISDPVITPVLDMSNINNGINSINGLTPGITVGANNVNLASNSMAAPISTASLINDMKNSLVSGVKSAVENAMDSINQNGNPTTIEVPVVIDGREIAKSTAVYMEPEINKLQVRSNRALGIV